MGKEGRKSRTASIGGPGVGMCEGQEKPHHSLRHQPPQTDRTEILPREWP